MSEQKPSVSSPSEPDADSIGRPGDWTERRYEPSHPGTEQSVVRKPGGDFKPPQPLSLPVTQQDYLDPDLREAGST